MEPPPKYWTENGIFFRNLWAKMGSNFEKNYFFFIYVASNTTFLQATTFFFYCIFGFPVSYLVVLDRKTLKKISSEMYVNRCSM